MTAARSGPGRQGRAVGRLLVDLVGQRDHTEIDPAILDLVARLVADRRVDELAVLFTPDPGGVPTGYLLRTGVSGGWEPPSDAMVDDPIEAWETFRRSGDGTEFVAVCDDVERRVAVRQGQGTVRFLDIDALAIDGPRRTEMLAAWSRFGGLAPAPRPAARGEGHGGSGVLAADMSIPDPEEATSGPPSDTPDATASREAARSEGVPSAPALSGPTLPASATPPAAAVVVGPAVPAETVAAPAAPGTTVPDDETADFYRDQDHRPPLRERLGQVERWKAAYWGLALVTVFFVWVFIRFTLDDSFITWRYGQTLVHSGHWNWNPTGPRVEAYTNTLYAVVSIIPALLRIPVELFFKLVSLGILAGYVAGVRRAGLPRRQEFLLLAVALASPVFYLQLFGGLETASFALLIAVVFSMVYRTGELTVWGYVAAAALASSRPEGIVFAGVAMVWALLIDRTPRHARGLGWVCGGWVVYWLWRWQHFGWFFPNPFYEKSTNGGPASHKAVDALSSLSPVLALAAIAGLVAVLFVRRAEGPKRSRAERLQDATPFVLAVVAATIVLGLYKSSNLAMDPAHRFYWQLLFPVVVVVLSRPLAIAAFGGDARTERYVGRDLGGLLGVGVAMAAVVAWEPLDLKTGLVPLVAAVVVLCAVLARVAWRNPLAVGVAAIALAVGVGYMGANDAIGWLAYRYRLQDAHEAFGHVLRDAHFEGGVATFDAGVLPYLLDNQVVDVGGLADADVVHGGLTLDDLRRAHVDLVILGFHSSALSPDIFGGPGAPTARQYADTNKYWTAAGVMFQPGYFLNYLMSPKLAQTGLPAKIQPVTDASVRANSRSDTDIVLDNLWGFPFLSS
ncbi:MAG TPA: hypothetical protein VHA73_10975 [Acidimicrobiales bacterium]|nr:hypothetical protein [Acidimicrobiales bacterium]